MKYNKFCSRSFSWLQQVLLKGFFLVTSNTKTQSTVSQLSVTFNQSLYRRTANIRMSKQKFLEFLIGEVSKDF